MALELGSHPKPAQIAEALCLTQLLNVSGVQPIFCAIEAKVAHRDS
jgi:hypothetical protein